MLLFGERIRAARMAAGLTQRQLGLLCGYNEKSAELTVQHWEANRRDIPLEKIRIVAQVLNLKLEDLIP